MFEKKEYLQRIKWYKEARFGMFIHWGIYAIPARGEWVRSHEEMSVEDYEPFFEEFDPSNYNPKEWAKAAKNAGMKYAVLTAKHHDGFCLFDTKLTDYKSTNTKCNRDLVREFLEAFREEGIKVGLYYSLLDWHHKDYPHYGDKVHPMRNNEDYKNTNHNFDNYLEYMHEQVKELCTQYGQLDIMWFDFSYDDMCGEKWRATELVNMIRSYQPNVLIDNRLEVSGEGFGSLATNNPTVYSGDFVSPERIIPPNGLLNESGEPLMWEACITMNDNWGYNAKDTNYKPASTVIKKLVECVSKGGNMLINVGPDANGNIPKQSLEVLNDVGVWMKANHNSIYGCDIANISKPENGRITRNENKLYYHILENSIGSVPLYNINKAQVKKIRLLCDGSELQIVDDWIVSNYPDVAFVDVTNTAYLPDNIDTVVEIELK